MVRPRAPRPPTVSELAGRLGLVRERGRAPLVAAVGGAAA